MNLVLCRNGFKNRIFVAQMLRNRGYFMMLVIAVFFLLSPSDLLSQCAMCKQAAESSLKSNSGSIARGLNSGILYLMVVPYLAIMFIFRKQIYHLLKKFYARYSKA